MPTNHAQHADEVEPGVRPKMLPGGMFNAAGLALAFLFTDVLVFSLALGDGGVTEELACARCPLEAVWATRTGLPNLSRLIS